jgi:pimeloyl-ACP methyl ester carboxylesterase
MRAVKLAIGNRQLETGFDFGGLRREIARLPSGLPLTIHHPARESRGVALLAPGWSGPRSGPADILAQLADAVAREGFTAARFDLPGRGDAPGEFSACDLDAMIASAREALAALKGPGAVFLLGMCSGGNVALGALTSAGDVAISGVVALSTLPFQPARTKTFERRRRWKNFKQYAAKALSPRTWLRLARGEINADRVKRNMTASEKPAAGGRNLKDSARDIERELRQWQGPALFVWGGGDEEAAPARAHFEKLRAEGMGAPGRVSFLTIDGASHNFYSSVWRRELAGKITAFLNDTARQDAPLESGRP